MFFFSFLYFLLIFLLGVSRLITGSTNRNENTCRFGKKLSFYAFEIHKYYTKYCIARLSGNKFTVYDVCVPVTRVISI